MMKRIGALAIVLVCVSLAGVVGPANAEPERLSWKDCGEAAMTGSGIRCADLSVPADWHRPGGDRTTVGLAKLPAKDPERRVGSLLVNLGGPAPVIQDLPEMRDQLAELTTWYDVIVFDPRGLGDSSGVTCPEPAPDYTNLMFSLGRQAWREFANSHREWAAGCEREAGPLVGNLDSWQVAHDMEAIRAALGEGGLDYYGNSYGTVYGQTYADLYPHRVHRMYLDSVRDHTERSPARMPARMAGVMRDEFREFVEWCQTDDACALHPENADDVWDELMAKARQHPLPAPGAGPGKSVGPQRLHVMSMLSVGRRSNWPAFAEALAAARAGDASGLYIAPPLAEPDTTMARLAQCSDFPFQKGWGAMTAIDRRLREIEPRAGWLMGRFNLGRCAGLPHQGTFPPRPIDADGVPPVLLVNGMRDPGTTAAEGRAVAAQLPGSVWFAADTDHAVYLNGNRCVREIVHRYLRTGDLPAPGRVCPADPAATR